MKLNKHIISKPNILYDGFMSGIDKEYRIVVGKETIIIKIEDIAINAFQNLLQKINENDLKKIIEEGELKNTAPDYYLKYMPIEDYNKLLLEIQYYKTESHLGLNYLITNNFLLLFTYGEKQPSRWILILEGVWEIE